MSASKPSRLAGFVLAAILALAAGIVAKWEGTEFKPYRDIVGVWTVCTGHTGPDVVPGKTYTRAECDALLKADLATANAAVEHCIAAPIPVSVHAAFLSAAFNIGPRVVCGSTLQAKANAGDWRGACAELLRWNRAGGREVRGLTNRRKDEYRLCVKDLAA